MHHLQLLTQLYLFQRKSESTEEMVELQEASINARLRMTDLDARKYRHDNVNEQEWSGFYCKDIMEFKKPCYKQVCHIYIV